MNVSTSGKSPKAIVLNVRERTRGWLNAVNLHWAGVGLLALVVVYLLVQMGIAWRQANSQNAEALAQQRLELKAAEISARPLEGLDVKLAAASGKADQFYLERLPISYSEIASELGVLKNRDKVRLRGINYSQPALGAGGAATGNGGLPAANEVPDHLTEVLMDASLNGDYRALVTFINGLERDKVFFLITGITLTGQQTGQVSLRLRLATFLRGPVSPDELEKMNAAAEKAAEKDAGTTAPAVIPQPVAGPRPVAAPVRQGGAR